MQNSCLSFPALSSPLCITLFALSIVTIAFHCSCLSLSLILVHFLSTAFSHCVSLCLSVSVHSTPPTSTFLLLLLLPLVPAGSFHSFPLVALPNSHPCAPTSTAPSYRVHFGWTRRAGRYPILRGFGPLDCRAHVGANGSADRDDGRGEGVYDVAEAAQAAEEPDHAEGPHRPAIVLAHVSHSLPPPLPSLPLPSLPLSFYLCPPPTILTHVGVRASNVHCLCTLRALRLCARACALSRVRDN